MGDNWIDIIKQRNVSIDIVRGIGITLVVFGHVFPIYAVTNYVYAFHMPLFFLLSGYTFNLQKHLEYPGRFLRKNILRLMLPYFGTAICSYILYVFLAPTISLPEITVSAAARGILNGNGNNLPFNNVLWFLPAFFCAGLIFLGLAFLFKGIKLFLAAVLVSIAGIIIGLNCHIPFGLDIAMTTQFFVYCGHLFREAKWMKKIKMSRIKGILNYIAAGLMFIMLILSTMNGRIDLMGRIYGQPLVFLIAGLSGSASVLIISISFEGCYYTSIARILETAGRASMYIFVSHIPIFFCIASACNLIWGLWIYDTFKTYWYVLFVIGVSVPALVYVLAISINNKRNSY